MVQIEVIGTYARMELSGEPKDLEKFPGVRRTDR
jgi:hypothetical protein